MNPRYRLWAVVVIAFAIGHVEAAPESSDVQPRPAWTSSRVKGTPEPPLPYRAQPVFPHLGFNQPTVLTSAPGTDRLFVAEQQGRIYSIPADRGCRQADLFLDTAKLVERLNASLPAAEQVALEAVYGLTFHPDFATNHKFYLCYVVRYRDGSRGQHPQGSRVVQLLSDGNDPPSALIDGELEIINWLQGGHNGGCIKFGHDRMLYISTGDGGMAFPPDGLTSGQDVTNLLAAVLRIDVDHTSGDRAYAIPADNPFVDWPANMPDRPGKAATTADKSSPIASPSGSVAAPPSLPEGVREEIWAYGMRNPWKMSFDRQTGELWVGDVGWELWELIYRVKPGDNFGWSLVEGRQPVRENQRPGPTPVVPPAVEIPHTEAASVTGGFVYRGDRLPELRGHYIFGDWETRRFWSVAVDGDQVGPRRELVEPTVRVVGFAERNDGELLLLDYDTGSIQELVQNDIAAQQAPFPRRLSETGLFASVAEHAPASGVVPFAIHAAQWADHAQAERWLGLPGDSSIVVHRQAASVAGSMFSRTMDYPHDAVLMKTLSLELTQGDPSSKRRIETQLLHFNGYDWRGYTYRWNEQQTDAELVAAGGATETFEVTDRHAPGGRRRQTWRFSSRMECIRCHNPWAEFTLAFNVAQLNRPLVGDTNRRSIGGETGAVAERPVEQLADRAAPNQLAYLYHIGVLQDAPSDAHPDDPFTVQRPPLAWDERPALVDPHDDLVDVERRARAYLHANCAHCHRFNGGGSARIYLPFDTSLYKTEAIATRPAQGNFGIDDAMIIAPGAPYRSVLYFRMAKSGPGHMPHLGSQLIDPLGLKLVHDWIQHLPEDLQLAEKLDQLIELDESAIMHAEQRDAAWTRWTIARRIATSDGRGIPTQADMDAASAQAEAESQARALQRQQRREELIAELLDDPSGAVALAAAHRDGQLAESLASLVIAAATHHDNIAVRDLFDPFLPDDQRIARLGDRLDAQQLLKQPGDVQRGRDLFLKAAGVSCRNCHRVGEQGTLLGPELSQIGKKLDRAKLLESLLDPSKEIDPKYVTWLVQTGDGNVLAGLLVSRSEDEVVLRDAQNKEHRIPLSEVEELFPQRTSLMPERLLNDLTLEQAADLLAWLESLK